jgi:hypothetical protein
VTFKHHCGRQGTRSSRWVPRPLQDGQVITFVFCALMRLMEIMRHVFHTVLLIPFDQRPYSRCDAADRVPCAAWLLNHDGADREKAGKLYPSGDPKIGLTAGLSRLICQLVGKEVSCRSYQDDVILEKLKSMPPL